MSFKKHGRQTDRFLQVLSVLAPAATAAVVWSLLQGLPEILRTGVAGFVFGALVIVQQQRTYWAIYAAAIAATLLGLTGVRAPDVTVSGKLALWFSFAAVSALVAYLVITLHEQKRAVGYAAARIALGEAGAAATRLLGRRRPVRARHSTNGHRLDRPAVAALIPWAGALLVWQLLDGSPNPIRMLASGAILGLFAFGLRRRPVWVIYGAATIAALMPLNAMTAAPMPFSAVTSQWPTFLGVLGVVVYLVSQWRQQTDQLAELEDLKARFVALTNHELRTPVAVLQAALETLLDDLRGEITPQQEDFLRAAWASSDTLADRIDLLTHLDQLDASSQPDEHRTPLRRVLDAAVAEFKIAADGRNIRLTLDVTGAAAAQLVPVAETEVVIAQLLDNAIKFSPEGALVEIRARIDGADIIYEVADEGPGIPPEQRRLIFESFYQPGDLFRRTSDGMGIGLAVARMAAERLGARIDIRGREPTGSCFSVRLPRPQQALPVTSHQPIHRAHA